MVLQDLKAVYGTEIRTSIDLCRFRGLCRDLGVDWVRIACTKNSPKIHLLPLYLSQGLPVLGVPNFKEITYRVQLRLSACATYIDGGQKA